MINGIAIARAIAAEIAAHGIGTMKLTTAPIEDDEDEDRLHALAGHGLTVPHREFRQIAY